MPLMGSNNPALVGDVRRDDITVRPVAAELVSAHHSHTHCVSRLVFADHNAYGEGSVNAAGTTEIGG